MTPPCLVVFAREPVWGEVKTRLFRTSAAAPAPLGQHLSPQDATRLYTAFIADVLENGIAAKFANKKLYGAGADRDLPVLAELAARYGYTLRRQVAGDLGARMDAAMQAELAEGAESVLVIGTDSPTLPSSYLQMAAQALSRAGAAGGNEVVIGPATDGGYYLIGAREPVPLLFAPGIAWGTSSVLATTLERIPKHFGRSLRCALLPFFYDCDTLEDLRLLCAHLRLSDGAAQVTAPHTRQVLGELGLL